jgi:sugar-specific transcriptional regulator TrmB
MDHLLKHLETFGLNVKEGRAYLALLELGKGTAYAIAKKAGLKRPTAYLVLDELRKKGLALKVPKSKNQIFIAKSPQEFFATEEERVRQSKKILPELLALAHAKQGMSQVMYFEGIDGIAEALQYRLKDAAGKEVVCFYGGTTKPIVGQTLKLYQDYYTSLGTQRTRTRAFAPEDPNIDEFRKRDAEQFREVKILPTTEYTGPVSLVEIQDGLVKIVLHKDRQALVIENPKFALLLKQMFEMVWKAKKGKK